MLNFFFSFRTYFGCCSTSFGHSFRLERVLILMGVKSSLELLEIESIVFEPCTHGWLLYPCYYHEQELVGLNGMDRKCSEATPTFFVVNTVADNVIDDVGLLSW
ncbi:hypothetical protein Peur_060208 [Populus x canadensis]